MRDLPTWTWRAAVLCALLWIGYSLHRIERQMPAGLEYETEQRIESLQRDVQAIRERVGASRTPSPSSGWDAWRDALPPPAPPPAR